MLLQRILGAALIAAVVALPVYFGGGLFAGLVAVAACLGVWELRSLLRALGSRLLTIPALGLSIWFVVEAVFRTGHSLAVLTLVVLSTLAWLALTRREFSDITSAWATTLAAPLYLGLTLAHLVLLREWRSGLLWVMVALLGTWATDIGAYFVGSLLGRHKLCPRISPGKSWEGLLGGTAITMAVLAGLLYAGEASWLSPTELREAGQGLPLWAHGAILGVAVSLAGVIGDLAESALKRAGGLKDAGQLIPGHGGLLDRVDSLVFTAPVVYYYLAAFVVT